MRLVQFVVVVAGSCRDLLQAHFSEGLPELAVAYILRDVLQALDYLHNLSVIHRCALGEHVQGGFRV